ncbi:MAG TPA: tetratricopeptide repeat-containing glycosyltransferase family protein [Gemmataceae bacterium]|nr:tetratricopeptide repeat-containing glycosyltransferase family protein [Gemmataceae bacterium]
MTNQQLAEYWNVSQGLPLLNQARFAEAEACFRQALRCNPSYAEAYNNLGAARAKQGDLQGALACFQKVVQLRPDFADGFFNLGLMFARTGQRDQAVACHQETVRLNPEHAEAHTYLALHWLMHGNYVQGWPALAWRWHRAGVLAPPSRKPSWDGAPLHGRTILLHADAGLGEIPPVPLLYRSFGDAGFGDTLQFVRYAPLVQQRGGNVVVLCQRPLVRLLSGGAGIDLVAGPESALPDFEFQIPFMDLPGVMGTTLATVPANIPYLKPEPELVQQWRHELSPVPGFKVGIVWQGNRSFQYDVDRSVELPQFEPLARLPGIRLFSLQVGAGAEHVASASFPITDLAGRFDPACFRDAAAAMMALDLVITIDSAPAHLAGALGVPVWTLLPFNSDFRWLLEREDSPWYPTMRLFRQRRPGEWAPVFQRLEDALREVSDSPSACSAPQMRGLAAPQ